MREHLEKDYKDASIDTISDDFLEGALDLQRVFEDNKCFNPVRACAEVRRFYETAFDTANVPTGFNNEKKRFELVDNRQLVCLDFPQYCWLLQGREALLSHYDIRVLKEAFYT